MDADGAVEDDGDAEDADGAVEDDGCLDDDEAFRDKRRLGDDGV